MGIILAGYRKRDGLTQAQLANKTGAHQSALAAMESGNRTIAKVMAKKLAKVFDTNYRNFL